MTKRSNEHFGCLQTASIVLNRYQDIEDILDEKISDKEKLKKIKEVNNQIGKTVADYLPG
jgi:hypothetical protein